MSVITQTMKLLFYPDAQDIPSLVKITQTYADACNHVSQYIFDHDFCLNSVELQKPLYPVLRGQFGLKSQFAISVVKTVTARYKAVKEQLQQRPYKWQDEKGRTHYIQRDLEWLWQPISFQRPQADCVRGRDYSFVKNKNGEMLLSLNTLEGRIKAKFEMPEYFEKYFNDGWKFGTGKIVNECDKWYLHIPMTKKNEKEFDLDEAKHVVGVDRGLRFIMTTYDETGKTHFFSGKEVMKKREKFQDVRFELQSRGTKSAKRALKRISGRENRWMSDMNHCLSKTLVELYGEDTLFVLEDLQGISFSDDNLSNRTKEQRRELRTWAFYQLEFDLDYKARRNKSMVLKVKPDYTSQRCPKCGRIHKDNRKHETHEYICDNCGYRSNDDRIGAMNIQTLGALYVSGDTHPRFGKRKEK